MLRQPNCCTEPDLETVKRLVEPPASWRDLMLCRKCNAYWQLDGQERMSMDGEDHIWEWYTPLSAEEAAATMGLQADHEEGGGRG